MKALSSLQLGTVLWLIMLVAGIHVIISLTHSQNATALLTFGDVLNISNNPGTSEAPQMAFSANGDIYVAWIDNDGGPKDTFFSVLASGDDSFATSVNLSNNAQSSFDVRISASGQKVYVVWSEDNEEILFVNGTLDDEGAISFGSPQNLSNSPSESKKPAIASIDGSVFVVWEEQTSIGSKPDIYFTSSQDKGRTFQAPANLSNTTGQSTNARVAIADSNVYVAWQDDTSNPGLEQAIVTRASKDGGVTFGDITSVGTSDHFMVLSDIVPVGDDSFYVLGHDTTFGDVFFASALLDTNGSLIIETPKNVSANSGFSSQPKFTVSNDGIVYVVWKDDSSGTNEVFFASATDIDSGFNTPMSLTGGLGAPDKPNIALTSSGDLYVAWVDSQDIILRGRISGEPVFEELQNLSNNPGSSQSPTLTAHDHSMFVTWDDKSEGNGDILFRSITASGEASNIIVESVNPTNSKWGTIVTISGTTNGAETDSVTVEWGDGSATPDIEITGSSWGPVEHSYDKVDTGTKEIIARLVSSGGMELAVSDPKAITVQKHETLLTLNNVHSVVYGGDMVASGFLSDADEGLPIGNHVITFNGTGSIGINGTSTDSEGLYNSQGVAPFSANTLWTIQANFAGDISYEASSSVVHTFDTLPVNASEFVVQVGESSIVDLSVFGASIMFDEVLSDGSVFVSECVTPENSRYLSLDSCLVISSAVETSPDSFAHITFSYQNKSLSEGKTVAEIDVFHETLDGFVDITESRSLEQHTVTGKTKEFSTFVMGVALHDAPEENAVRQQVYVGRNELVFNDISSKSIEFDEEEYQIGSSVEVSITDTTANTNATTKEMLVANITSSSDTEGIQLNLVESGNDTGIFRSSFTIADEESSSAAKRLHTEEGDSLIGSYLAASSATFKITIDEIAEAGVVEVIRFDVNVTPPEINTPELIPIGDAYTVRLLDSQLGASAEIDLIMSYSNVDLTGAENEGFSEVNFRLMQSETEPQDITRPEWIDISPLPPQGSFQSSGLDIVKKTITATTDFLSNFTIAVPRDPGGGGGGLPRPGTGIILDAVAGIPGQGDSDGERRRSGGGGSRSTTVAPTPAGNGIETSVRTDSGMVIVRFESVEDDSGQIRIESNELASYEQFFDKVVVLSEGDDEHGIVNLEGRKYATAGEVFDIDASAVRFEGTASVTIPYDQEQVDSFANSEHDVKFLHYNEEAAAWEDMTSSVDEEANTVTGILESFSPVVAVIIIDNPADRSMQGPQENSMLRIGLSPPSFSLLETGRVMIATNLSSYYFENLDYVVVVQVVDDLGIVQHIEMANSSLGAGQESPLSMSWNHMKPGSYTTQILLLSDLEHPQLLSEPTRTQLKI